MTALSVYGLQKKYPAFELNSIGFSLEAGRICGLIGANGAGKTTLLKSIVGLVSAEGECEVFGHSFRREERVVKSLIGYVGGGFRYYPQKTVRAVARAVAPFYTAWDERNFCTLLDGYGIDPGKKIAALSDGMKVKFYLALALSHGARLLILDEPTSGLDPLSREEFCTEIVRLAREEGAGVLFSTHIPSDLMRAADDIVFLSGGRMLASGALPELLNAYAFVEFSDEAQARETGALGIHVGRNGCAGLLPRGKGAGARSRPATLEEVMVCLELEERRKEE